MEAIVADTLKVFPWQLHLEIPKYQNNTFGHKFGTVQLKKVYAVLDMIGLI
jgi:hypothetical protein